MVCQHKGPMGERMHNFQKKKKDIYHPRSINFERESNYEKKLRIKNLEDS